jgi:hypothetical protein
VPAAVNPFQPKRSYDWEDHTKPSKSGDCSKPLPRVCLTVATLSGPSGTLALRLPEEEGEKFLKKYKATLCEAYKAVMKEYVAVLRRSSRTRSN